MSGYFANEPQQPRVRRAHDAVTFGFGLVLLVWAALNSGRVAAIEQALVDLFQSIPLWFEQVYRLGYFGGLVLVVALVVGVILQGSKRLDLLRDMALALLTTAGIALFLIWWLDGSLPPIAPELSSSDPVFTFPILRVAVLTSVIAVASPHLARPIRRFGWLMVVLVAISGFGLGLGFPGDAGGGFALGLVSGGAILLLFGSPKGYPNRAAVDAALAELGIAVASIEPVPDRSWGVRRLSGTLQDGSRFDVKAYGRDATDSQYLSRAWHQLWYRDMGQNFAANRFQAVEHEALALRTAHHHGVATPAILAVGAGGDDMALLATAQRGEPVRLDGLSTETLTDVWREVGLLHGSRVSHGSLTLDAVMIDGGTAVLQNLYASTLHASDVQMSFDVVSLLFASAVVVGADDAVAAARAGLGDERIVAALPYVQTAALSRAQRGQVDKPKRLISELRESIASTTGAELPEEAKLRRVSPKDLVMPALSLIAAYALLGMLTDIDFVAVWAVVQDASWALIVIGFLVGHVVFFPEAMAMIYATGYALPLKPLVILQVSVKWIGLAVPSAAGRVTMNTLFLRKYGVSPSMALTQGVLDGIAGFSVEAGILLLAFIASDLTLTVDTGDVRWGLLFLIVAALIAGSVIAVLRIERLRTTVVPALKDAWELLRNLLADPKRTIGLIAVNLAARAVLALTLWFILQAVGAPLPFVTALVATVATNLLAGLVPIPGGIGVAEAVLTSFLVFAGLGSEEAFAVAVVFRIATFYIPAAEGFFAMRWLEDKGHL